MAAVHPEDEPTPPYGVEAMDHAFTPTPARPLRAVPTVPVGSSNPRTGAFGRPIGKHRPTALHRLVEVSRVLTGGLMVLAIAVIVAPLVLSAVGPGVSTLIGHLVGAGAALTATGIAASRRTPVWAATVAAGAVPVIVLAVLAVYWWA
ncbi:hypothetical protein [Actinomycetospora atypica]|uniref:Uncharacterized protein n=1 Tax=Actinomycetospora atypica TaxID=1290095 RepID=A0ABV9YGY0_9PSEU